MTPWRARCVPWATLSRRPIRGAQLLNVLHCALGVLIWPQIWFVNPGGAIF